MYTTHWSPSFHIHGMYMPRILDHIEEESWRLWNFFFNRFFGRHMLRILGHIEEDNQEWKEFFSKYDFKV